MNLFFIYRQMRFQLSALLTQKLYYLEQKCIETILCRILFATPLSIYFFRLIHYFFIKKEKYRCDLKKIWFFCRFWSETASRYAWILKITIFLNSLGQNGMENCVHRSLYVVYFKSYVFSRVFFYRVEFAMIVNKAKNEPQGTLFQLGTCQILKIDILRI